jgi:protein SOK2
MTTELTQPVYQADPSGQTGPPGKRPKITATLWEDEGTLCFQVESAGICVARRAGKKNGTTIKRHLADRTQDNCYINGTKLLNVANMTRGRRDGLLKGEKNRKVVKIGPMHLKGVW